ncbi:transmembrane repetitive protein [Lysobacter olei]
MTQRVGAVTGARVEDIVGILVARSLPAPRGRDALLNRWQAFSTLWRQQWQAAPREERYVRWAAATFSVLVNLFFAFALIWLMYLQFLGLEPPPQGEDVVQVEFLGAGTPEEVGGGSSPESPVDAPSEAGAVPSPEPVPEVAQASDTEAATEASLPEAPAVAIDRPISAPELAGTPLAVPERDVATPSVSAAPQAQAVAVSEPTPDTTDVFVLPPTRSVVVTPRLTPREQETNTPQIQERDVTAPVRANVPIVETQAPSTRPLSARMPQVMERDVAAPVRAPTAREIATRSPSVRDIALPTQSVRERDVRAPAMAPTAAAAQQAPSTARVPASAPNRAAATSTASATSSSSPAASAAAPGAAPAARAPSASSSDQPGAGPKTQPAPGAWATPARGDDWGASARNTPGAQRGVAPGVFNADGSVRVPEGPGSASPGMPPGTVTQEIANLDRAGTWLKRKPTDFEPTAFDKYWVPNETLLAEWVRKSIKEVLIPIPGTSKRIRCAVALLALGGACAISDPNLNEQPATARPPPDVPFKPHLQDDNGSVRPGMPPGG